MFNPIQIATKRRSPSKGATRRSSPPPKRKTPWWLWLLVPTILVAFIYGLTQLNQVTPKPKKTEPVKVIKVETAPVAKKAKTEVKQIVKDKPKKDTFEFYQILQDSEVDTSHVDAYQSTPRGEQDFYYMLQAASFRSSDDADRLRAKLIISGLVETTIRKTIGKDEQPWYRIVLGPYESRSKMNRTKDKLVSMQISPYSYKIPKE